MIEVPLIYGGTRRPAPTIEALRGPVRPALQVASALDRVRRAPSILSAMRGTTGVLDVTDEAIHAGLPAASLLGPILEAIDDSDTVVALAAVHALGRVPGPGADVELAELIVDGAPGFEDHAMWALADRPATPELVRPLAHTIARGGMPGFHAQATLARWAFSSPLVVLTTLESALSETASASARRYLVETIGLVPGRRTALTLERVATDLGEPMLVRAAAIAAFTERSTDPIPATISAITHSGSELGEVVRSVEAGRRLRQRGLLHDERRSNGIRVAQIHLSAPLDPTASHAGVGDAGGIAALLSQLGPALSEQRRVAEVISIGRGLPGELVSSSDARSGQRYERLPLAVAEGATFTGSWPSLVAVVRGIRAAFLATYVPDVVHLRMADPGSLAGAIVSRQLRVPFVYTFAPDPQGPIATAETSGSLDRASFAAEDARGALWYRTNLVERLARDARELVLFPRAQLRSQLKVLTGIDIDDGPPNHTVVPEGIDVVRADRAAAVVAEATAMPKVVSDLQRAVSALPTSRHGLPLVLSVGRLHEMKGMARLVEAFAIDETLADRANLVIVGGGLEHPTAAEVAELTRIKTLFDAHPGLADRVLLLGHRPNDEISLLSAVVHAGWGQLIGPRGAYACGSAKEEFGLAILEAMAAGLPVVAPRNGGPATYLEDGLTGVLVETTDVAALGVASRAALDLAEDEMTAVQTRQMVSERFTLDRMARTLAAVYRITAGASTLALPIGTESPSDA